MTKKERIQAAIRGEKPDKMPYSFWTHMPGTDLDPEAISQKTYEFYKKYDFDFVKTMNNGMYAIEDFGCTVDYSEIVKGGVAKVVSTPISCAADWRKLTVCPCTQGSNARELRHHHRRQDQRREADLLHRGGPWRRCQGGAGGHHRDHRPAGGRGHRHGGRRDLPGLPDELL